MTPEQAAEHAVLVHAYFKKLLDLHMELVPATELAVRYAQVLLVIAYNYKPKEPWET